MKISVFGNQKIKFKLLILSKQIINKNEIILKKSDSIYYLFTNIK